MKMKHIIQSVLPGSIAHELEITPGDVLLTMNGKIVQDVLDFRFFSYETNVKLEIKKPNGDIWELDIEKDEDEELGLIFENTLMDKVKACQNKCVFCFIDQLPEGMRSSLYFKDDDPRFSFLTGNYVTLTNMSLEEVKRIAYYHLSPLHISVHAADITLREKMTGSASLLFDYLRVFYSAGITMHFQIVLCKGLNDGVHLDNSINTLLGYRLEASSLSIVPAGMTRYRQGLFPLEPFTPDEAKQVIKQVEYWQKHCLKLYNTAFVFCADEWYLLAGLPIPLYEHYEEFPQLENGVGMMSLFEREFNDALPRKPLINKKTGIVTGQAAAGFMRKLVKQVSSSITVYEIVNDFFGPMVNVSGLLTGQDIIAQLKNKIDVDFLFVPQNAFMANSTIMLDGTSLDELNKALGIPVIIGSSNGGEFVRQLYA
jgi:putative radical SAM enzyme (TIGR03279 family)